MTRQRYKRRGSIEAQDLYIDQQQSSRKGTGTGAEDELEDELEALVNGISSVQGNEQLRFCWIVSRAL
jgi:hypothetical protein